MTLADILKYHRNAIAHFKEALENCDKQINDRRILDCGNYQRSFVHDPCGMLAIFDRAIERVTEIAIDS